jgi:hypothetical protein
MPKKTLNTHRLFQHQIEDLSDIADCVVPEPWRVTRP